MNLLELSEQEIIRRNSMEQLRQMGIEPVSYTHLSKQMEFRTFVV